MATRFYFRDTDSGNTTPTTTQSTTLPVGTANGTSLSFRRSMNSTAGTLQGQSGGNTLAQTAQQSGIRTSNFSAALAAQTIAAATWTFAAASAEGNAAANIFFSLCIYVWRPGTAAKVGTIYDANTALGTEWATAEEGRVFTVSGSAVTCADNDVIVCEAWYNATQSMASAYTAGVWYNGATAPTQGTATSDAASYLENPNTISFYTAPTGAAAGTLVIRQAVNRAASF